MDTLTVADSFSELFALPQRREETHLAAGCTKSQIVDIPAVMPMMQLGIANQPPQPWQSTAHVSVDKYRLN